MHDKDNKPDNYLYTKLLSKDIPTSVQKAQRRLVAQVSSNISREI